MAEQYVIQKTMKAAQVVEYGKPLQINTVPVPEPGPHEILVKIQTSGKPRNVCVYVEVCLLLLEYSHAGGCTIQDAPFLEFQ